MCDVESFGLVHKEARVILYASDVKDFDRCIGVSVYLARACDSFLDLGAAEGPWADAVP